MGVLRTGDTFRDSPGFEYVLERVGVEKLHQGDTVQLDLQDVSFVSPYCMLSLLLLAQEVLDRTGRALHLRNAPPGICQYLERMNFFSGAGAALDCKEVDGLDKFGRNPDSNNLLEITEVLASKDDGAKAVGEACTRFRERVAGIIEAWTKNVKIDRFVTVLSETGQNIFEHSGRNGYVAIQRYCYKEGSKVTVWVADRGVGIRGSFAGRNGLDGLADSAVIAKVVVDQLSSKRPKGAGLHQVLESVKKARGGMLVRSGTGLFRVRPDGGTKAMDGLTFFPGTQVEVWLD
jgi:anti-sigma regulatory factor (Ser/Thr protein kinase)